MGKNRRCVDCGAACNGARCRPCFTAKSERDKLVRVCVEPGCTTTLNRSTKGDRCFQHRQYGHAEVLQHVERIVREESNVAPSLGNRPTLSGSFMVGTDWHIPFHDTRTLVKVCEVAQMLGITKLIVAGDLIHADIISKYANAGKQVRITDELVSCSRVLGALEMVFSEIHIIVGNHDQRVEKMVANWRNTKEGREAFEVVARMLDADEDAESVAYGILERFFASPRVKIYPLPEIIVNATWSVMHPGTCSRVSPQTERKMANKLRKSVIGGHNHLFGIGFDDSGLDVAANIGHGSDSTKYRYKREKITTFPESDHAHGFCAILCDEDSPGGRILPIAVHDRWFDLALLKKRLDKHAEGGA